MTDALVAHPSNLLLERVRNHPRPCPCHDRNREEGIIFLGVAFGQRSWNGPVSKAPAGREASLTSGDGLR